MRGLFLFRSLVPKGDCAAHMDHAVDVFQHRAACLVAGKRGIGALVRLPIAHTSRWPLSLTIGGRLQATVSWTSCAPCGKTPSVDWGVPCRPKVGSHLETVSRGAHEQTHHE